MDSVTLSTIGGVILSLAFEYIPKFHDWYNALDNTTQRAIMAGALLLVALVVFGVSCANLGLSWQVACDKTGAVGLLNSFFTALIANQATFGLLPKKGH